MIIGKLYRLEDEPNETCRLKRIHGGIVGGFDVCDLGGNPILEQFPKGMFPQSVAIHLEENELIEVTELKHPMDYEIWKNLPKTKEAIEIMKQDLRNSENRQLELF